VHWHTVSDSQRTHWPGGPGSRCSSQCVYDWFLAIALYRSSLKCHESVQSLAIYGGNLKPAGRRHGQYPLARHGHAGAVGHPGPSRRPGRPPAAAAAQSVAADRHYLSTSTSKSHGISGPSIAAIPPVYNVLAQTNTLATEVTELVFLQAASESSCLRLFRRLAATVTSTAVTVVPRSAMPGSGGHCELELHRARAIVRCVQVKS
jgi:hypothetical protein